MLWDIQYLQFFSLFFCRILPRFLLRLCECLHHLIGWQQISSQSVPLSLCLETRNRSYSNIMLRWGLLDRREPALVIHYFFIRARVLRSVQIWRTRDVGGASYLDDRRLREERGLVEVVSGGKVSGWAFRFGSDAECLFDFLKLPKFLLIVQTQIHNVYNVLFLIIEWEITTRFTRATWIQCRDNEDRTAKGAKIQKCH